MLRHGAVPSRRTGAQLCRLRDHQLVSRVPARMRSDCTRERDTQSCRQSRAPKPLRRSVGFLFLTMVERVLGPNLTLPNAWAKSGLSLLAKRAGHQFPLGRQRQDAQETFSYARRLQCVKLCTHRPAKKAPDLWKHCARGGTRTGFRALPTLGTPGNMRNSKQSQDSSTRSEAKTVDNVHTLICP